VEGPQEGHDKSLWWGSQRMAAGGGMELVVAGGGQGKGDEAVKLQVWVKAA